MYHHATNGAGGNGAKAFQCSACGGLITHSDRLLAYGGTSRHLFENPAGVECDFHTFASCQGAMASNLFVASDGSDGWIVSGVSAPVSGAVTIRDDGRMREVDPPDELAPNEVGDQPAHHAPQHNDHDRLQRPADFIQRLLRGLDQLHLDPISDAYPVLFAAALDDRVHANLHHTNGYDTPQTPCMSRGLMCARPLDRGWPGVYCAPVRRTPRPLGWAPKTTSVAASVRITMSVYPRPVVDALGFANAAAAISVTRLGAQSSAPDRAEVEKLLSTL